MIMAGMATHPPREQQLQKSLKSIVGQVDVLHLYMNGYRKVPDYISSNSKIVAVVGAADLGDAGKFQKLGDTPCYFFSLDDDIKYPPDYVRRCVEAIERYSRKCIVGVYAHVRKGPYRPQQRFAFSGNVAHDVFVHTLGTSSVAFHTDTIQLSSDDFAERRNLADVTLVMAARAQSVPLVSISRKGGWLRELSGSQSTAMWKTYAKKGVHDRQGAAYNKFDWPDVRLPVDVFVLPGGDLDSTLESLERQYSAADSVWVLGSGDLFEGCRAYSGISEEDFLAGALSRSTSAGSVVLRAGTVIPPAYLWEVSRALASSPKMCLPRNSALYSGRAPATWERPMRWVSSAHSVIGFRRCDRFRLKGLSIQSVFGSVRTVPGSVCPLVIGKGSELPTPSIGSREPRKIRNGVSLVIPSCKRNRELRRALKSIPPGEVDEVIVVDDNRVPMKFVHEDVPFLPTGGVMDDGGSFSRNCGMLSSSFSKIVYLDDDDVLRGRGSVSSRANALDSSEIVWGDIYFHSFYAGYPKFVRRVGTKTYNEKRLFIDAVHTPITGSQVAHVLNPDKFFWIVGGRKADKRFVLRARELGANGSRVPVVVATYGKLSSQIPAVKRSPGLDMGSDPRRPKKKGIKPRNNPRRHRR